MCKIALHFSFLASLKEYSKTFRQGSGRLIFYKKGASSSKKAFQKIKRMILSDNLIPVKAQPLKYLESQIEKEPFKLTREEMNPLFQVNSLIGRAPSQVIHFLSHEVDPFLKRYKQVRATIPSVDV